jgi:hypothetical protein
MSVINRIALSQLDDDLRFDSQYYTSDNMLLEREILAFPTRLLGRIALITDGQHGYFKLDEESEIRQITAKCIKDGLVDKTKADHLSTLTHNNNLRSSLAPNDVLVTTAGTIGEIGLVTDDIPPANIDQDIGRIAIHDPSVSPLFIWAFLQSKFGRFQIDRSTTGQVQTHLSLEKMKKLRLPLLSNYGSVEDTVSNYVSSTRASRDLYQSAQQCLESELGLDKLTFQKPIGYTARFSQIELSLRFDAEHYNPEFHVLKGQVTKSARFIRFGTDIQFCRRGQQPRYSHSGPKVVNSKHVQPNKVVLEDNRSAFPNPVAALNIGKNDLLLNGTGVGTIGRAAPYLREDVAVPDNHVTMIRTFKLDPVFLSVFLNSRMGQAQVRKYQRGSSGQLELYPQDIMNFEVWDAPDPLQQELRRLIVDAGAAQERSQRLLAEAKMQVEQLIEEVVRS